MANNVKTVLIPIVVVVVAAGVAYGAGRWQGHQQTEQVRATLDKTRTDLTAQLEAAKADLGTCRQKADRLEARRQIHMALEELGALNFGYAQQHLKDAGNILAGAAAPDSELGKLAKQLEGMQIQPSAQLDQQRKLVRHVADRFDELVPPAKK